MEVVISMQGPRGAPTMLHPMLYSVIASMGFASFPDGDGLVLTHLAGVVRDVDHKPIPGARVSLRGTLGY
jgi:hypothetical protein